MRRESVVSRLLVAVVCVFAGAAAAQTGPNYVVNLRAANGQFLSAEWGGEREVFANRNSVGAWERFVLVDLTGGDLMAGDAVRLRAQNGKYLVAESGMVNANRLNAGQWETFVIFKKNGTTGRIFSNEVIRLLAWDGRWVVAESGGGGYVKADRTTAGPWEAFTLSIAARHPVDPSPLDPAWVAAGTPKYVVSTLQVHNGQFTVAEWGGGREVKANRWTPGDWERFVIVDLSGGSLVSGDTVRLRSNDGSFLSSLNGLVMATRSFGGPSETFRIYKAGGASGVITSGTQVNLQAWDGRWFVAENGGGAEVKSNRTTAGPWESFKIGMLSTFTYDPSPLGPPWSPSQPPPPPVPPLPPPPPGTSIIGSPECSPQTQLLAYLTVNPSNNFYVCCKPAPGAPGTASCPFDHTEFVPDCRHYSGFVPGVRFEQPWGCIAPSP